MNHWKGAAALTVSGALVMGQAAQVRANPVAVPAVAACVASVGCVVGVVAIAGVTYWVLSNNGQELRIPVLSYTPNPEQQVEDWEDYVWADNEQQVRRKCSLLAEQYTGQGGSLVTVVRVRRAS
ncbi:MULTISPECIES: hypothetical protein [Cyanophyceae]|uniref:Uncharacterized protein n=1 Tax=Leptolyngbya subtilissima DQ-A4 TaxID=2933933 RepID=A0ABV0K9U8_9CYAN|nr:hypothetical protein [Nodosilinea sp. FACHB-141]MBD2110887.1 hypothetical protein [Nodosilinea sp. FACHB-141]